MTRPSWLGRAARNRHRHAIEQASRRWRGGRRSDSGRTRRKFDFHTGKDPEKTRKALEQWVPRNDWGDVNWLLVGLGQEVQTEKPKLLRKALDSSDPAYAVAFLGRIGMETAKVAKAEGLELVT